jgi:hypothetical protein
MVFSLVPSGFQAIQKQLAAESIVRMIARDLMISSPENVQLAASRLASEISDEFGYRASVSSSCIADCDSEGGWYRLRLQIDSAVATKVAVVEK